MIPLTTTNLHKAQELYAVHLLETMINNVGKIDFEERFLKLQGHSPSDLCTIWDHIIAWKGSLLWLGVLMMV